MIMCLWQVILNECHFTFFCSTFQNDIEWVIFLIVEFDKNTLSNTDKNKDRKKYPCHIEGLNIGLIFHYKGAYSIFQVYLAFSNLYIWNIEINVRLWINLVYLICITEIDYFKALMNLQIYILFLSTSMIPIFIQ